MFEKENNTNKTRHDLLDACRDLAQKKSILHELDNHLRAHGFAGSTTIPQLVFLSAYTRIFNDPVSLVIKGTSGSGKSFSLRSGLRYIPELAYHEVHGLSAKALVHAKDLSLKHRFLVIQEMAGFAKDGLVFLRQLLTEGKVTYMTVNQTRDGHEGKQLATLEGPTGVMMTTTLNSLHFEDETRMLSCHVDQSPEQIRKALMIYAGKAPPQLTPEDFQSWHALHDFVCSGTTNVTIPYQAELIARLPVTHTRVLRDTPKVLALIRAHALLHQQLRECIDDAIVATLDDYEAVYNLVREPLSIGLRASVPAHISDVVTAVIELFARKELVSQTEVAKHLNRDQAVVSRNLGTAVRDGYIINENPGQGRQHAYRPGQRELSSQDILPSPDDLRFGTSSVSPSIIPDDDDRSFEAWANAWPHSVPVD